MAILIVGTSLLMVWRSRDENLHNLRSAKILVTITACAATLMFVTGLIAISTAIEHESARIDSGAATQLAATVTAERELVSRYGHYSTCSVDLKAISRAVRMMLAGEDTTLSFSLAPVVQQLTLTVVYDPAGAHSASRTATIATAGKPVSSCAP